MIHVLTVPEVAEALRLSLRSAEALVSAGRIRSFKIGHARRVTPEALWEFIRSCEEAGDDVEVAASPATMPAPSSLPPPMAPPPRARAREGANERPVLPAGIKRWNSLQAYLRAHLLTGTSGAPSGSLSKPRRSRKGTSTTPATPSTSGAPTSKDGA